MVSRQATMSLQRARLLPPPVPATTLARPALERKLDEAFGARLTTVVAGPGFGKTTAVAAWARDVRCVWCQLSPADAASDQLVWRLVDVVATGTGAPVRMPGLGDSALGTPEQAEAVAAVLSRTLDRRLDHDLVVVLDDVQELGDEGPAVDLLDALCRQLPRAAHLVLVSQHEPPVRTGRLRLRGELVEIEAPALAFTFPEILEQTSSFLDTNVDELATAIYERTGGWPAAVRLLLERLRNTSPDTRLGAVRAVPEELVAYLLDEVLAREPPATQEVVRILAALEFATEDLVEACGVPNPVDTLESLVRRGLFITRDSADRERYSLHALVRGFAPELLGMDAGTLAALRRKAARWHEEHGELATALRLALLAKDSARVAALLSHHGADLLAEGSASDVLRAADLLAGSRLDPTLEQTLGDAHAARGEWEAALARYERAAAASPTLPAGLAWRIGRIHFDQGRLDAALAAYSQGGLSDGDPAERALLLAWTASCRWSHGERADAQRLAEQALIVASEVGEPRALAAAHNVLMLVALGGDAATAARAYASGIAAADRARDPSLVVRLRANRATQLVAEGAFREALETISPALEAAELAGGGLKLAFPLMKRGEISLHLGRLEDAIADFRAALAIYDRHGSLRRFGALANLADAHLLRGEVVAARVALEEALRAGSAAGDAQLELYASSSLARALVRDDPARALELAGQALLAARRLGFGLEVALLSSGWVSLAAGDPAQAARRALEARGEAERHAALPALAEALVLAALSSPEPTKQSVALEQAASIYREAGAVLAEAVVDLVRASLDPSLEARSRAMAARRVLQEAGVRLASAAQVAGPLAFLPPESPPAVEVRTLGGFVVLRHGRPIPISAWRSRQARELLKVLVARRCRPVPREQLMAVLWPDEAPEKLSGRLSFVLSTLRSVLDPERPRDAPPLVEAQDDALRLRSDLVTVDVEVFLHDAELALADVGHDRVALLEAAEAGYGGDFLEEDPYADWAVSLREHARATYIAVVRGLVEASLSAADHPSAVRYLLRILERDSYDESAHVQLVTSLQESRAHGEARRAYRRYVAAMAGLGVEPVPYPQATRAEPAG